MSSTSSNNSRNSPSPSSTAAFNRMKAVRRKGTAAELRIREALDVLDLAYEVNARPLPELRRSADILFREERIAIFIDGCFWHGCPLHGTKAKANARFWEEKIARNKERDRDTDWRLGEAGWRVIRVWEHERSEIVAKNILTLLEEELTDTTNE